VSSDDAKQFFAPDQVWVDFAHGRACAAFREEARVDPTRKYLKMFPSPPEANSCWQILQWSVRSREWAGAGMRTNL
jgi:hypothetical protein